MYMFVHICAALLSNASIGAVFALCLGINKNVDVVSCNLVATDVFLCRLSYVGS